MKDPANYRKMCEPFESVAEANAALEGFQKDLYELRNKWRIRDVSLVMAVNIKHEKEDGGEFTGRAATHIGSSQERLELCAYGLGIARGWSRNTSGPSRR